MRAVKKMDLESEEPEVEEQERITQPLMLEAKKSFAPFLLQGQI